MEPSLNLDQDLAAQTDDLESLPSIDWGSDFTSEDGDSTRSHPDSAFAGSSLRSSTMSLGPSEYQILEENGRTYHRQGTCFLPNDEVSQSKFDIYHHALTVDSLREID
jgi:hypothetical protein